MPMPNQTMARGSQLIPGTDLRPFMEAPRSYVLGLDGDTPDIFGQVYVEGCTEGDAYCDRNTEAGKDPDQGGKGVIQEPSAIGG